MAGRPSKEQKLSEAKKLLESDGYQIIDKDKYRCRKCGKFHNQTITKPLTQNWTVMG